MWEGVTLESFPAFPNHPAKGEDIGDCCGMYLMSEVFLLYTTVTQPSVSKFYRKEPTNAAWAQENFSGKVTGKE